MIKLLRRFLVVAALMFWQGGFLFYSSVVVHVGTEVLGSHLRQGFVTRQVTNYLNLAGAVALPILAWDIAAVKDGVRWRRRMRWAIWGVLVATLAGLFWMHVRLDGLLDAQQQTILDKEAFYVEHQVYLLLSTVQWIAAMLGLGIALVVWRDEDTV